MSWQDDPVFAAAVRRVLQDEGGWQNTYDDPGNWTGGAVGVGVRKGTHWGISAAQYPDLDIANLTEDEAAAIYYTDYWQGHGYDQIRQPEVASKVFDTSVWCGPPAAGVILQRAMRACGSPLIEDGIIGRKTLNSVNSSANTEALRCALCSETAAYVRVIHARKTALGQPDPFFQGWLTRAYRP